jgi:hypothetical protein
MAVVDNDHTLYVADNEAGLFSYDGMVVVGAGIDNLAKDGVEDAAIFLKERRATIGVGALATEMVLSANT